MAKYKLDIEDEYDFLLFGICSHIKDYRLAWLINQKLTLELVRSEQDLLNWTSTKLKRKSYARFEYTNESNGAKYYLINNNAGAIKLVPDQKQFDFFLLIKHDDELSITNLVKELKTIHEVLTVYELQPESIIHKDNLIFDE